MRRRPLGNWILVALAAVVVFATGAAGAGARTTADGASASAVRAGAAGGRPLHTAVMDPFSIGSDAAAASEKVRRTGARFVRLQLSWIAVAPGGTVQPTRFEARNPSESQYRWAEIDAEVKGVAAKGLTPIVYIEAAPLWTQEGVDQMGHGPLRPRPAALADFATAAARRYSGGFRGLPRVRYWQVWNEPNLSQFLMPQTENGKPVSPAWYRSLVNAMARSVHAVRRDNVVVAGGLAPYGGDDLRVRPLEFMREMLCMSKGKKPRVTCNERVEFDVWSHHPYAYGGPTYKAFHPDDVSIGNLGKMRSLLMAADRAGHVVGPGQPELWVTEFSYDSMPPDPKGVPVDLHTRWTSESLFRMWKDGVSLVTWFLIQDQQSNDPYQSGLYLRGADGIGKGGPKPALRAFRFPFVAFRERGGAISYWGRTPAGVKKAVVVEQNARVGWRRVAGPAVDGYGIFSGRIAKAPGGGALRARLADRIDVSAPFSLKVPKDRRFCLFGWIC